MTLRLVLDRRTRALREGPLGRLALVCGIATASAYRRTLRDVRFVGITGSAGKTTTKELVAAIAARHLRETHTIYTRNRYSAVGKLVLRTRPWHDACIAEVAASNPGDVARVARLIRPVIAAVTVVGVDHMKSFATLEDVAQEKGALVEALPPDGVAILNADDPNVLAMASRTRARVVTYGTAANAQLRAEDVSAAWPDTLSFTLVHEGRRHPVGTRLYGRHWVPSALAALGVAVELGIPLEEAIAALAEVPSLHGRMALVQAGGVSIIRDEFKAPLWGFDAVFDFLGEARAPRKRIVLGGISNARGARAQVYKQIIRRACEVTDEVIVAGPEARYAVGLAALGLPVVPCFTVREASDYLRDTGRDGDLVLLKSVDTTHHSGRIALAQVTEVGCWRTDCGRIRPCDTCSLLRIPAV